MSELAVGFIGLSHLHPRSYMPLFDAVDGATVTAVADANPAVLEPFARDFPVRGYADWREMIEKEKLDLALFFLPHVECPEAAVACAARGINLVVEKPMASNAAGVRRMQAAAAQNGVVLATPLSLALSPRRPAHEKADRRRHPGPGSGLRRPLRRRSVESLYRGERALDADQGVERRRPDV